MTEEGMIECLERILMKYDFGKKCQDYYIIPSIEEEGHICLKNCLDVFNFCTENPKFFNNANITEDDCYLIFLFLLVDGFHERITDINSFMFYVRKESNCPIPLLKIPTKIESILKTRYND